MKGNIFEAYANAVAKQFHLELDEMFNKDKRRDLVDARQMLYYLCMERPIRVSYMFFIPLSFMAIRKLRKWLKKMKTTRLSLS